jgi:hypothetical protein
MQVARVGEEMRLEMVMLFLVVLSVILLVILSDQSPSLTNQSVFLNNHDPSPWVSLVVLAIFELPQMGFPFFVVAICLICFG